MQLIDIPEQTASSEVDEAIIEIFVEEVEEILEEIVTHFKALKNNPADSESIKNLLRSFHTLKGSGRLVGAMVIGELGWCFENMLNQVIKGNLSVNDDMLSLVEQVEKVLPSMLKQLEHNILPSYDVLLLISQADYLTNHDGKLDQFVPESTLAPLSLPGDDLGDIPDLPGDDLGELPDLPEDALSGPTVDSIDLSEDEKELCDPNMDTLSLSEGELDIGTLGLPEGELELVPENGVYFAPSTEDNDTIEQEIDIQSTRNKQPELSVTSTLIDKPEDTLPEAGDDSEAPDELKDIFLEEADEIIEKTQSLLDLWTAAPNNIQLMKELQREMHTLKGGARMVGILPMGNLSHSLEDVLKQIVEGTANSNSQLQDIVQNSVDELAAMLVAVRDQVPLEIPTELIKQINATQGAKEKETEASFSIKPVPPEEPSTSSVGTQTRTDKTIEYNQPDEADERIHVKATLIDKLTNLAGELSISRAHMEQQQGEFKNNLVEMEQTVIRLRDQLRRLDIEVEAQINFKNDDPISPHSEKSKKAQKNENEFDPLELDEHTKRHELARFLAESVDDLSIIQDALKTLTRQSETLLVQQSRIGAELRDGIMRTRMIPFAKKYSRLERIVRKTAKELNKPVKFIINGENIEFEKTVLDKIIVPLDHLIRNAIGHGIEETKIRQQMGKPSVARITVDLSKEGAEFIIKLSDDGAGLNLPAIRKKAEERELIKPDTVINDHDLMHMILKPGFSTAKLTQISGRGVGMDIVITDIKKLSGSLHIDSKTGEGTTFEIRLPVSLSITQALLVHIGDETMAVPMNYLNAVMRAPRSEVLGDSKEVRYYKYMDKNYRVFHLGELLGFGNGASVDTPFIPTLLVRAADRWVALLVDAIEGSKEIVVKPVGRQIDAIRWIAGATILGDGRVVLVLDVPTIVREDSTVQSIRLPPTEIVKEEKPVAKTVMVVDDSITVRKVTARLLKRQEMEVMTAKDGLDAVAQLQEKIPDLMLLDVEMPRMDGYELATQVRNNPDWKHLPIIMITSRTGPKHKDKADKIGINRFLGKPYKEADLLENIHALLAEKDANHH